MSNPNISPTRNIVLAIDGSQHATAAVQFIRDLPVPKSCKITAISVLIPRNAQHHAILKTLLNQTKASFQEDGREIETHLLTGYPAEQIIKFATENNPDLLVLGAKGLRGTVRILLGGVAQQVVEYASCPVLIVRAPYTGTRRVLFATDGSEHSAYVVQHLDICPLPIEAKLTVLHVLLPEISADMISRSWPYGIEVMPPIISSEIDKAFMQQLKEEETRGAVLLQQTLDELTEKKIKAVSVLRRGDAATQILEVAQSQKSDLIIVGSRGLNQIRGWLLGSVSSKITHYADCSVLVVKKPTG